MRMRMKSPPIYGRKLAGLLSGKIMLLPISPIFLYHVAYTMQFSYFRITLSSLMRLIVPILMRRAWCDSSWTPLTSSSRCPCRGLWRTPRPLTCRLRPSTPLERWRTRWVSDRQELSDMLLYVGPLSEDTHSWPVTNEPVALFYSHATCWSLNRSTFPNPLTGKEMEHPPLWCPTKPDSGTSRKLAH